MDSSPHTTALKHTWAPNGITLFLAKISNAYAALLCSDDAAEIRAVLWITPWNSLSVRRPIRRPRWTDPLCRRLGEKAWSR